MGGPSASVYRRRRALAVVLVGLVVFVAAVLVLHGCAGKPKRFAPAAATGGDRYDPLAYDPGREAAFETQAAGGLEHVLYEKSPGGALASARRTARWRPLINQAVRGTGIDPNLVEGIVLLESAGRPDIIAGSDVADAAGLAQILSDTATGLLGMHVDLAKSRSLTKRLDNALAAGRQRAAAKLRARRRLVDDRFNPPRAIAGMVRYLVLARTHFGRDDLAVASYHMGIGNLDHVLSRFGERNVSYTRLYFASTPLWHPSAYSLLSSFGDDSSTYLWRVLAARQLMRLYRSQPQALRTEPAFAHPGGGGTLAAVPKRPARLGLTFGPGAQQGLRPAALSALLYIGVGSKDIAGGLLRVVATGPDGWSFAIARRYRDRRQALAFQFMLDRLQTLNLIRWDRNPFQISVEVSSAASTWLPGPAKLARDALR